jgi:hypothetical protein
VVITKSINNMVSAECFALASQSMQEVVTFCHQRLCHGPCVLDIACQSLDGGLL